MQKVDRAGSVRSVAGLKTKRTSPFTEGVEPPRDFFEAGVRPPLTSSLQMRFGTPTTSRAEEIDRNRAAIHAVCNERDPILRNLLITQAHHDLALGLRDLVGHDGGANFHAWATWGSKKAGASIRNEDIPYFRLGMTTAGMLCGSFLGPLGMLFTGLSFGWAADAALNRTRDAMAEGNRMILKDQGAHTAAFISTFRDATSYNANALDVFLARLDPRPTDEGGESLLRTAYASYYAAKFESDPEKKQPLMLLANCAAVLHEQTRLQPYIDDAVLRGTRALATYFLMSFELPGERLSVCNDVPIVNGRPYPAALENIKLAPLRALIGRFKPNVDVPGNSSARDWCELPQRMRYIFDLFRSRHVDSRLFEAPYSAAQQQRFLHRGVPPGPL